MLVRKYKSCAMCYRLFQQRKNQTDEAFSKQMLCWVCDAAHRAMHPKKPTPKKKKVQLPPPPKEVAMPVIETILDKPERKAPEPMPVSKPKHRQASDYNYKMKTLDEACEVYAKMNNLPVESARKLWGLK